MSAEKVYVEMMRQYPIPGTPEEGRQYFYFGWALFAVFALAVLALTLFFS